MPVEGELLFRGRDEILQDLIDGFKQLIPDVFLGEEGNLRLLLEVMATVQESSFLAVQILSEDQFVQTANPAALDRHGQMFGAPRKIGNPSVGTLKFTGTGGTNVPVGTEVAYDPGTGEPPLYFNTTAAGVIPNPGIPGKPTVALLAVAGNLTGTFEYAITFVTAEGETLLGVISDPVVIAAQQARLTAIPLGGPGTTARRIYRTVDGSGVYALVATLADNVTATYDDNIAVPAGLPPVISTAERITLAATSEKSGLEYNVLTGTITALTDAPNGVTSVTNPAAFTGGTDPEATEDYRTRLIQVVRNPMTGSAADLKTWAEEVAGVDSATVFPNDNLGTPTNGHVTVRFSTANGGVPDAGLIATVQTMFDTRDLANIIIHVGAFTQVPTNVSVTITPATGYVLADVSGTVTNAITQYIVSLGVGETFRISGVTAAVFGLPGVADVVVTVPGSNQATGSTSKRSAGVITVS
jgi:uncharacterized phage protein gp47/JayE